MGNHREQKFSLNNFSLNVCEMSRKFNNCQGSLRALAFRYAIVGIFHVT